MTALRLAHLDFEEPVVGDLCDLMLVGTATALHVGLPRLGRRRRMAAFTEI
jgi:hypothetical protein